MPRILVSCYSEFSRSGEQFIPEHVFGYSISGTMEVYAGEKKHTSRVGEFALITRNQLAKFTKTPPSGGVFKMVSVIFDQQTLRDFSTEYGYTADKRKTRHGILLLHDSTLYKSYVDSIESYQDMVESGNSDMIRLKVKELLLLIMKINPGMKDVLFDFTEPGKIDLEAFMNKNFHFNVGMNRFAYLTGRSLATFKRDFNKIYHTPPNRWLQKRRLQEAFYLIKEKGRKPSDVYIEVGFENLSHFSYSFKQTFGVAPSGIGSR